LALRIDRSSFADLSAHELVPALAAELGADVRRTDAPLNIHPLYVPTRSAPATRNNELRRALDPSCFELPNAMRAYAEVVTFPHQMLLSAPEDMQDVADSFEKIRRHALVLKNRAHELAIHAEV